MIQIKEAIIVEGRYDVNVLRQLVDTVIIETGGFRIFNDQERLQMIRRIAETRGILILTDSDGAGFIIRNFIKGAIPSSMVKHAYVPDIFGKEGRKRRTSKEGKLGVEGMRPEIIYEALRRSNATILDENSQSNHRKGQVSKADLYALGLSGGQGSAQRRKMLLNRLLLPEHMSANALLEFINAVTNLQEIQAIICSIGHL